jgi:hypothetical protein
MADALMSAVPTTKPNAITQIEHVKAPRTTRGNGRATSRSAKRVYDSSRGWSLESSAANVRSLTVTQGSLSRARSSMRALDAHASPGSRQMTGFREQQSASHTPCASGAPEFWLTEGMLQASVRHVQVHPSGFGDCHGQQQRSCGL